MYVVDEGNVIAWMPVERKEDRIELNRVQQTIDWFYHLEAVLLRRAIADVQCTTYEVVLHIYYEECGNWTYYLKIIFQE